MTTIETRERERAVELEPEVTSLTVKAQDCILTTAEDAQWASDFLQEIKAMDEVIVAHYKPMKEQTHKAHQTVCSLEKQDRAACAAATLCVKGKLGAWQLEQKAKAYEELQARQREAEAVERARREEEARQVAAAIKAQREAAAAAKRSGDDALAARMREEANEQAALQRELDAQPIQAIVEAAPEPARIAGTSVRMDFDIVIQNPDLVPREYCTPNEKMIRGVVRSTKGKIVIPGVKVVSKPIVSVRG